MVEEGMIMGEMWLMEMVGGDGGRGMMEMGMDMREMWLMKEGGDGGRGDDNGRDVVDGDGSWKVGDGGRGDDGDGIENGSGTDCK